MRLCSRLEGRDRIFSRLQQPVPNVLIPFSKISDIEGLETPASQDQDRPRPHVKEKMLAAKELKGSLIDELLNVQASITIGQLLQLCP